MPTWTSGQWLSELAHAYALFEAKGHGQRIVGCNGGKPPLEPRALKWPLLDESVKARLNDPARKTLYLVNSAAR